MKQQPKAGVQFGAAVGIGIAVGGILHRGLTASLGWWTALLLGSAVAGLTAFVVLWIVGRWIKKTDA